MRRKPYPSDMTDEQWALIEPLLPRASRRHRRGRPRKSELREVVNALFYHTREGCTWRARNFSKISGRMAWQLVECSHAIDSARDS